MSDLSKYCVHLLEKDGLGPVRGGFPISNYVIYRAVMAVGVGILYNGGGFPILYCVLTYVFDFVCFIPSKPQTTYHAKVSELWLFHHCA